MRDASRNSVTSGARGERALPGAPRPAPRATSHFTRRPRTESRPAPPAGLVAWPAARFRPPGAALQRPCSASEKVQHRHPSRRFRPDRGLDRIPPSTTADALGFSIPRLAAPAVAGKELAARPPSAVRKTPGRPPSHLLDSTDYSRAHRLLFLHQARRHRNTGTVRVRRGRHRHTPPATADTSPSRPPARASPSLGTSPTRDILKTARQ